MAKSSEKIRMVFTKSWFEQFMGMLYDQQKNFKDLILEEYYEMDVKSSLTEELKENQKLINKIIQYAHYEESKDGKCEVRVDFYPSEAREIIWQFLYHSFDYGEYEANYYEEFKEKHDAIKKGELVLPVILTRNVAFELYSEFRCGREYLVRNQNGKLYYVDHGYTELIKKDGKWQDKEPQFNEFVFEECKLKLDVARWEDEEPFSIEDYLKREGWIDENNNDVF